MTRALFSIPQGITYLAGHSLGPSLCSTADHMQQLIVQEWGKGLVSSWNQAEWIQMPTRIGQKIAGLIGAKPDEVIVCDSTSINLFKLMITGLRLNKGRHIILTDAENFPTDLYMAEGVQSLLPGVEIKRVPMREIAAHLSEEVALVSISHVHYKTGERVDIQSVTEVAHQMGALVLVDVCHSAGIMPLCFNQWHVDMAVGCGYKYLNGGPGAPAFVFVAERHLGKVHSPLPGWMGHQSPFMFDSYYVSSGTIRDYLCGTPAILSMGALEHSLSMLEMLDFAEVRKENNALSGLLTRELEDCLGLTLESPRELEKRGGHVTFSHPDANRVAQALIARGILVDFRAPSSIRFGLSPLYIDESDIDRTVVTIKEILQSKQYLDEAYTHKREVT